MGSVGMLLADWSIEILKSHRLKRKQEKEDKKEAKNQQDNDSAQTVGESDTAVEANKGDESATGKKDKKEIKKEKKERERLEKERKEREKKEKKEKKKLAKGKDAGGGGGGGGACRSCQENQQELEKQRDQLSLYQSRTNSVVDLVNQIYQDERGCSDSPSGGCEGGEVVTEQSLTEAVQKLVIKTKEEREERSQLKAESSKLAEGIGRQLKERDRVHAEKVRSLETLMKEKERQLLSTSNTLRQQLAAAKRGLQQLEFKEEQLLAGNSSGSGGGAAGESLEQEVASLRMVLEMRRVEVEQLRVANNCLMMEVERCRQLELQLQQLAQRTEEMDAVIKNKNNEIRQLFEEQERLNHQLEIEEASHLSCQQELERSQWSLETFIKTNRETILKNVEGLKNEESGLILDLVHKDKSVAYSINC